jgi:hypothetical protein
MAWKRLDVSVVMVGKVIEAFLQDEIPFAKAL